VLIAQRLWGHTAITYTRVRRRLTIVIDAMPKTAKEIYMDTLLSNIRQDLIEIRRRSITCSKPDENEKKEEAKNV
jgi:hypothetical protein